MDFEPVYNWNALEFLTAKQATLRYLRSIESTGKGSFSLFHEDGVVFGEQLIEEVAQDTAIGVKCIRAFREELLKSRPDFDICQSNALALHWGIDIGDIDEESDQEEWGNPTIE